MGPSVGIPASRSNTTGRGNRLTSPTSASSSWWALRRRPGLRRASRPSGLGRRDARAGRTSLRRGRRRLRRSRGRDVTAAELAGRGRCITHVDEPECTTHRWSRHVRRIGARSSTSSARHAWSSAAPTIVRRSSRGVRSVRRRAGARRMADAGGEAGRDAGGRHRQCRCRIARGPGGTGGTGGTASFTRCRCSAVASRHVGSRSAPR